MADNELKTLIDSLKGNQAFKDEVKKIVVKLKEKTQDGTGLTRDEINAVLKEKETEINSWWSPAAKTAALDILGKIKANITDELVTQLQTKEKADQFLNGFVDALDADKPEKMKAAAAKTPPDLMTAILMMIMKMLGMDTSKFDDVTNQLGMPPVPGGAGATPPATPPTPDATPPAPAAPVAPTLLTGPKILTDMKLPNPASVKTSQDADKVITAYTGARGTLETKERDLSNEIKKINPVISVPDPMPKMPTVSDSYYDAVRDFNAANSRAALLDGVHKYYRGGSTLNDMTTIGVGTAGAAAGAGVAGGTLASALVAGALGGAGTLAWSGPGALIGAGVGATAGLVSYGVAKATGANTGTWNSYHIGIDGQNVAIPLVDYGTNHGSDINWAAQTGKNIKTDHANAAKQAVAQYNQMIAYDASMLRKDARGNLVEGPDLEKARQYGAAQIAQQAKAQMDENLPIDPKNFEGLDPQITSTKAKVAEGLQKLKTSQETLLLAGQDQGQLHSLVQAAADARERPGKFRQSTVAGMFSTDAGTLDDVKKLENTIGIRYVGDGKKEGPGYIQIKGAEGKVMTFEVIDGGKYAEAKTKFDQVAQDNKALREDLLKQNQALGELEAKKALQPEVEKYQKKSALEAEHKEVKEALDIVKTILKELFEIKGTLKENEIRAAEKAERDQKAAELKEALGGDSPTAGGGAPSSSGAGNSLRASSYSGDLPEGVTQVMRKVTPKKKGKNDKGEVEESKMVPDLSERGEALYKLPSGVVLKASELGKLQQLAYERDVPLDTLMNDKMFLRDFKNQMIFEQQADRSERVLNMAELTKMTAAVRGEAPEPRPILHTPDPMKSRFSNNADEKYENEKRQYLHKYKKAADASAQAATAAMADRVTARLGAEQTVAGTYAGAVDERIRDLRVPELQGQLRELTRNLDAAEQSRATLVRLMDKILAAASARTPDAKEIASQIRELKQEVQGKGLVGLDKELASLGNSLYTKATDSDGLTRKEAGELAKAAQKLEQALNKDEGGIREKIERIQNDPDLPQSAPRLRSTPRVASTEPDSGKNF